MSDLPSNRAYFINFLLFRRKSSLILRVAEAGLYCRTSWYIGFCYQRLRGHDWSSGSFKAVGHEYPTFSTYNAVVNLPFTPNSRFITYLTSANDSLLYSAPPALPPQFSFLFAEHFHRSIISPSTYIQALPYCFIILRVSSILDIRAFRRRVVER